MRVAGAGGVAADAGAQREVSEVLSASAPK